MPHLMSSCLLSRPVDVFDQFLTPVCTTTTLVQTARSISLFSNSTLLKLKYASISPSLLSAPPEH